MEMTLRWYGPGYDSVSLKQIRQVPGVKGVVTTLMGKQPGEVWTGMEVQELKAVVEAEGLLVMGIESINISDDIKIGTAKRDEHIENYIKSLESVGKAGIKTICYNFMPVFDWTRTDLARGREDGSTVLAYNHDIIDEIDPECLRESMEKMANGFALPGWEPERLDQIEVLFEAYSEVDEERLFQNLVYFLEAISEVCEKYNIRMAIHPDDPAWPIFGLPRIVRNKETIMRLLKAVNKPHNGLTLCTGSLGTNPRNDICDIIHAAKGRIPFAHVRNLRFNSDRDFEEAAHLSSDGSIDMYAIMKALNDIEFDGIIRPDHGRMLWGEVAVPGYGLYDRAIGAAYLQGIWEALEKSK
ncbi:MAG: mannonate dehydratase [Lachnospiraceae bacterium]